MELVYLWVEDYKNIHRQGFNFSPKFNCNYDGETLTIKENDNYIENFFGENINVTAIVGKNGSGKSSLCNFLDREFYDLDLVYFHDNIFYSRLDIKLNTKKQYKIEKLYIVDDFYDNYVANMFLDYKNDINPNDSKYLTVVDALDFDNNAFDFIDENFIFTDWNLKILSVLPNLNIGIKEIDNLYGYDKALEKNKNDYLHIFLYVTIKLIMYILAGKPLKKSKYWEYLYILSKNFSKKNYLKLLKSIDLERLNDVGNYNLILKTLQDYDNSVAYIEKYRKKQKISKVNIKEVMDSGVYKTFNNFADNNFKQKIIEIDLLTKNDLKYSVLSSGEQQRIFNNALLISNIHKCKKPEKLFLIDEPDTYLHPNWQKKIIKDYVAIFKKYNTHIHLVVTTHSPFLLSDIPKENIIFLDTYESKDDKSKKKYPNLNLDNLKDGNCINVSSEIDLKPFGANIHELLSHGFFMESGLMGEFAKDKIQEIIDFLNNKKIIDDISIKKEEIKPIINNIGEPFLKRKLLEMYFNKFKDEASKKARKEELLAEKKRIEEELKKYD